MNENYFNVNEQIKNKYGEMLYNNFLRAVSGEFSRYVFKKYINSIVARKIDFEKAYDDFTRKNHLENYKEFNELFKKDIRFEMQNYKEKDVENNLSVIYDATMKVYDKAINSCATYLKNHQADYLKVYKHGLKTSDFIASLELTNKQVKQLKKKYAEQLKDCEVEQC